MSKRNKLLNRFLSKPEDFTYNELVKLPGYYGYVEIQKGKTSGSRVAFINEKKHIIILHRPHPHNEMKHYQLNYIEQELRKAGVI